MNQFPKKIKTFFDTTQKAFHNNTDMNDGGIIQKMESQKMTGTRYLVIGLVCGSLLVLTNGFKNEVSGIINNSGKANVIGKIGLDDGKVDEPNVIFTIPLEVKKLEGIRPKERVKTEVPMEVGNLLVVLPVKKQELKNAEKSVCSSMKIGGGYDIEMACEDENFQEIPCPCESFAIEEKAH